jgi:hypothetical protein
LLNRAIKQVNDEFGVKSIFFVEDTSLRLEGLSKDMDYPGLAVCSEKNRTDWRTRTQ